MDNIKKMFGNPEKVREFHEKLLCTEEGQKFLGGMIDYFIEGLKQNENSILDKNENSILDKN